MTRGIGAIAALSLSLALPGCASKPAGLPAAPKIVLPFIENDFPQALARARASNLPMFVEVWAPW